MIVCWCVYQASILLFVVGGQRSLGGRWEHFGQVCAVGVCWCESPMWRCVSWGELGCEVVGLWVLVLCHSR